ncbi:MAG: hypothetical protein KDB00_19760 [Planctomycetales bacterium]|nr:hypothetical protein [Planctomycetales bacterium]
MSSFDENLLFGVLALQNDFITRDALLAGIRIWLRDRSSPLHQVLIDLGHLTAEDRRILAPLVERHLAQHGGDAETSLAAIEAVSSLRSDLRELGVGSDQIDATTVAWQSPLECGRYQRLRLHAMGGLGEVYVARDQDLDRDVALKQVQKRFENDPNLRARFFVEAKITGALEHPGIVPVYGLGADADGRPYYAMRFVRGQSLKEAIDEFFEPPEGSRPRSETTLKFRMLLQRFTALSFSTDSRVLASTGWDGVCFLHRPDDGTGGQLGVKANDGIMTVRFSPKGSFLAFGGYDNKVHVWRCADDIKKFVSVGQLSGHSDGIDDLVFSSDERTLITACDNNTLRVWDIGEQQERISLVEHTSAVEALAMTESGDLLISGSRDGTIRLWQAATIEQVQNSEWWQKYLKSERTDR